MRDWKLRLDKQLIRLRDDLELTYEGLKADFYR